MKSTTRAAGSGTRHARYGSRGAGPWIGRTGIRLALLIVLICLAAIGTIVAIGTATVAANVDQLQARQSAHLAQAVALAASLAHTPAGWERSDLTPVMDLIAKAGVAAQIRSRSGRLIRSSPGYAAFKPRLVQEVPVMVGGQKAGSVTLKFDHKGLGQDIARYETLRWHIRIAAAVAAVLIAAIISLLVARLLTAPVDRLVAAVRAMGAGDSSVRVGDTRGVHEVRELSAAFDQMADSISAEEHSRRDMAADMAHELRTPIAVLQAGLESMQDGVAEPTPDNLGLLRGEVVRLAQMADDLRILASGHSAELKVELATHDLAAIAAEAGDSVATAFAAANVSLTMRLTAVDVRADARRIGQVLVNLLSNAVKFTPAGGSVTLETGPAPSPRFAIVRVSDTGIGIAADDLPFVTQRFFRGQSGANTSGSGIGLAIVDQLVQLHHGHLEIASEPGLGTQVTVTLPRAGDRTP